MSEYDSDNETEERRTSNYMQRSLRTLYITLAMLRKLRLGRVQAGGGRLWNAYNVRLGNLRPSSR